MTLTLDNRSQNKESSLTQALRQIQQLNSKIQELEQQHQDYVQKQQNLIAAIAEICVSPIQEIQALRILIYGERGSVGGTCVRCWLNKVRLQNDHTGNHLPSSYKRAKQKLKRSPSNKEGDRSCQKWQLPKLNF